MLSIIMVKLAAEIFITEDPSNQVHRQPTFKLLARSPTVHAFCNGGFVSNACAQAAESESVKVISVASIALITDTEPGIASGAKLTLNGLLSPQGPRCTLMAPVVMAIFLPRDSVRLPQIAAPL